MTPVAALGRHGPLMYQRVGGLRLPRPRLAKGDAGGLVTSFGSSPQEMR